MRKILLTLTGSLLLFGCSGLQKSASKNTSIPALGTVIVEDKFLTGSELKTVGKPHFSRAIPLTVKEMEFCKKSFKNYQKSLSISQQSETIQYHDSLEVKPTYLLLEISDQIALQQLLNSDENTAARNYLTRDENYAMVAKISMATDPGFKREIQLAEMLFLRETEHGQLALTIVNNNRSLTKAIPNSGIFDYELCRFCWGETRYGKKQVEAIVPYKNRCPEGTEQNASKLDRTKEYLKL